MGTCCTGELVYGYVWEEEGEGPFEDMDSVDIWGEAVQVDYFGHYDVSGYGLIIAESEVHADWAQTKPISSDTLAVRECWADQLAGFIADHDCDMSGATGPGWWLTTSYG